MSCTPLPPCPTGKCTSGVYFLSYLNGPLPAELNLSRTLVQVRIFITFSSQCDPNLDVYAVWVDSLDPNFPRIAFFANRRIKVGEELTFDYQMTMSEVGSSSPRKKERIKCHCGAQNCREYLC